jgi:hypothetical protein
MRRWAFQAFHHQKGECWIVYAGKVCRGNQVNGAGAVMFTLNSKTAGGLCLMLSDIADGIEADICVVGDLIEKM